MLDARKIKILCRKRGLTLRALLRKAGVSPTAYYSLARKDSVLPASIHALAETLGISPSYFLTEEEVEVQKATARMRLANEIHKNYPQSERDNIYHTLVLLEETPVQRLNRSLRRGRGQPFFQRRSAIS